MLKSQYSRSKKRSRKIPLKIIFLAGLFFCLLGTAGYFLFFSSFLWIGEIKIQPLKDISVLEVQQIAQKNLEGKIWYFLPQKSFILAPIKKIKQDILDKFSEAGDVRVVKEFKLRQSLLVIEVKERDKTGIWCQISYLEKPVLTATTTDSFSATSTPQLERQIRQCFYFDKKGIIFQPTSLISGGLILNLFSAEPADLRTEVASPAEINFILETKKELAAINTAFGPIPKIMDFEKISPEDLRVSISENWQIYFDPTHSLIDQINALRLVLDKEIKEVRSSLEYIDLRIEGRVYYK